MTEKITQQSHTCTIQTITPVHVGSGNVLNENTDFFYKTGLIGKADPKKILEVIGGISQIQKWTAAIEDGKSIIDEFPLIKNKQLHEFCSELILAEVRPKKDLKEHIRNELTRNPLLPGSSIKGAIRTALLAPALMKKFENDENLIKNLTYKDKKSGRIKFKKDTDILKSAVEIKNRDKYNPQNDIFKHLKISDVEFNLDTLRADNFLTLNMNADYEWDIKEQLTQSAEFVAGQSQGKITFTDLFFKQNKFGIKNLQDFITKINKHTLKLVKREKENFDDDFENNRLPLHILEGIYHSCKQAEKAAKEPNTIVVRMGAGSGWDFMTGSWLKEISDEEDWEFMKKLLAKRGYEEFPYPKTRRLLSDYSFPGFVKLTFNEI